MNTKEQNKKISEEIMKKIKSGDILTNRYDIPSKSKKEVITKRLCEKIFDIFKEKNITMEKFAEEVGVSKSTINQILNFHCDKVSLNTCVEVLEKLSDKHQTANEALIRMAVV